MSRVLTMLLLLAVAGGAARAQTGGDAGQERQPPQEMRLPRPQLPRTPPGHPPVNLLVQRRRLMDVDRLLAVGNVSRAEALINELAGQSLLTRELLPRRIRLADLKGDHAQAADLCREALRDQPRNANLWRELLVAELAQGLTEPARAAADSFLVYAPDRRGASVVITEAFGPTERPRLAVAFIDSMRRQLGDSALLARQRALGLLAAGRQEDAAAELSAELRRNAYNLALIRTALLDGPYEPRRDAGFVAALARKAAEPGAVPAETVLAANLHLADGDAAAARAVVEPLLGSAPGRRDLLQNAVALQRELPLLTDEGQVAAATDYLLVVARELAGPRNADQALRRRAAQVLAGVGLNALQEGRLDPDPRRAAARFGEALDVLRQLDPASRDLYAGQIALATFTRDRLHDPAGAAARLESMLLDLDLPLEAVAIVRLTLGECYLAAADTARARAVLTSLGRDPEFRDAGGHAHYHLARLDLAEDSFATARDRFAVVAMDNPAAPYANDALDLGLAVAEELDNPNGGPTLLALYARSVYWDLVDQPAQRRDALRTFILRADAMANPDEPRHLLERARWELAGLEEAAADTAAALDLLNTIVTAHPDGRYPAAALAARARLLADGGHVAAARAALEQLLVQYPDWLFADDARDALRRLP